MKFKILVCFLLIGIQSQAQKSELTGTTLDVEIGFNLKNKLPIHARVMEFEDPIIDVEIHPQYEMMTIQLRELNNSGKYFKNKGSLVGFNPKSREISWTRKLKYHPYSLRQKENIIVLAKPGKTLLISPSSGNDQLNFNYNFYHFDLENHRGLAYPSSAQSSTLYSIDLRNSKPLWERKVKKDFGWNYLDQLNDSTILLTSSGLHLINLNTGKGWETDFKTGEKDYTGTIIANAAGVALGLLTGMFMVNTDHKTITGVVSNALVMDENIYQANREYISNTDLATGKEIWRHEFPKNLCSKSSLFQIDNFIYMVNYGYGYHGQTPVFYGKPFIACFDANSGERIFFTQVDAEKFAIRDFEIKDMRLCLVTRNKLMEFDLESGQQIRSMNANLQPDEKILGYLESALYTYNADQSVQNFIDTKPSATYVYTNASNIHGFNLDNKTATVHKLANCFLEKLIYQDMRILSSTDKSIIIDANNNVVSVLELNGRPLLYNGSLYYTKHTKIYAISMDDILSGYE